MIAHEFRTPLTAIKGYASFLEESNNLSDEEHRYIQNIRSSTERLVLLVNDFLEVARLQSGKIKLDIKSTDVSNVVERTINDLQPIAKEKNLKLVFDAPKNKINLDTDANRLVQVLTNIITNSLKYTEKGTVTVSVEEGYKTVSLIIKDTGTGISADDQKKLFAPFTRVGNVDKTNVTGTGLGMWITKQLVEFLGGTIGVESIRGVGTHIVITFKAD
jgi:signal transduction histidine kinase